MISALERAVIAACAAFREDQIGEAMRRHSPSTRHGGPEEAPQDRLAMFEVNGGAPITRTLHALQMIQMAGKPFDASAARDYLEWIQQAMAAVQRLAQMCWQPIPKRERTQVLDEDDLGPAASPYLPASRQDEPGPALQFESLRDSQALEGWYEVSRRARATPCYAAAHEAGEVLRQPEVRKELLACREAFNQARKEVLEGPPITVGEALRRQKELIRGAYDHASPELRQAAFAIRAYSELINHLLWAVLCAAERDEGLTCLEDDLGAVRLGSGTARRPGHISLVMQERVWIGHPPAPFLIERGVPFDGLYLLRNSLMQFERTGLIDIGGTRLASLERAPASRPQPPEPRGGGPSHRSAGRTAAGSVGSG